MDIFGVKKAPMVTAMFSYYHGWCKNAYLHYVWSVWLVASLVASTTSWTFPIACIALVWRTREKGTEFFCTTRRTKKNKVSLILFRSLGALIAYCNRSHPHSRNNQQSSHSCRSRCIRSLAVRSRSSGCIPGSSSCCNLDSSSGPGLKMTNEAFVTTLKHTQVKTIIHTLKSCTKCCLKQTFCCYAWNSVLTSTAPSTSSVSTGSILLLLVDLFGLGYFNFTLKTKQEYST